MVVSGLIGKAAAGCGLAILLVACTDPTPYAPAVERDGYSDQAIEENRYRVSFKGNTRTPRETVETYLLYRAAEVTVDSGHDWFKIADQDTEAITRFRGFSSGIGIGGFGPYFYRSSFSRGFFGSVGTSNLRPVSRYEAFANILVFRGEKPDEDGEAYDARSVIQTLGPDIILPEQPDN